MKKKKYNINIKVALSVSSTDIEDLMCCALEGGIGYWACLDNTLPVWLEKPKGVPTSTYAAHILMADESLVFFDTEKEEVHAEHWELSLDKLFDGIQKYVTENPQIEIIKDGKLDMFEVDGQVADEIIQYALFGEVVYG